VSLTEVKALAGIAPWVRDIQAPLPLPPFQGMNCKGAMTGY